MPTQLAPHADTPPKDGPFRLVSDYRPAGDQPRAIEELVAGLIGGERETACARGIANSPHILCFGAVVLHGVVWMSICGGSGTRHRTIMCATDSHNILWFDPSLPRDTGASRDRIRVESAGFQGAGHAGWKWFYNRRFRTGNLGRGRAKMNYNL